MRRANGCSVFRQPKTEIPLLVDCIAARNARAAHPRRGIRMAAQRMAA
jgi:hypothetical protein